MASKEIWFMLNKWIPLTDNSESSILQYIATAFLLIISLILFLRHEKHKYAPGVPIVGITSGKNIVARREHFRTHAKDIIEEGYKKYKGKPFYVPRPLGEQLVIPAAYVEELKTAPVNEVDFVGTFLEMYEGKYTTMGSRSTLHPRVTKGLLNQNLESMVDPVYDEIVRSFGDNIPPTDEWVEINISDKMVVIVARASSRMFGGTTLSRNVEWIRTNIEFATDAFLGAQKIKRYPSFLKPIAAILIPEISKIKKHYQLASEVIVPLLSSREDGNSKGHDFLQWLTDESRDEEKDKDFLAAIQLKTTFAALHTSAAAPIQVIYDLCHRPEYIPELRKEIEEVLEQYGSLTRHALLKLHKLDSFMKESQRHNPLLLCTFERVITKDYQMSDGFIIPKGTTIGAPAHAIGMDGEIFPSPEKFDGFRFSDIRADATDLQISGRAQWVSSNLDSMHFGYGRHACPGRFFASQEIKQIMVHLLLTYDFKFPPGTTARPDNLCIETQLIPSHSATIWLRKRAT